MATEEPKYKSLEKLADFELREYDSTLVAEVLVDGDMSQASNKGFRLIADYIFGNNIAKTGGTEKIAMTTPVTIERAADQWRMHFVMPNQYKLGTLPTPSNKRITLREIPARKVAVVRFSGIANEAVTTKKTQELLSWMAGRRYTVLGTPELARYNPPWTLPFLRRNEVMIEFQ